MNVSLDDIMLGNYINIADVLEEVTTDTIAQLAKGDLADPILISKDILKDLGFSVVPNNSNKDIYYMSGIHLELIEGEVYMDSDQILPVVTKHVHTLQNIFKVLTGTMPKYNIKLWEN